MSQYIDVENFSESNDEDTIAKRQSKRKRTLTSKTETTKAKTTKAKTTKAKTTKAKTTKAKTTEAKTTKAKTNTTEAKVATSYINKVMLSESPMRLSLSQKSAEVVKSEAMNFTVNIAHPIEQQPQVVSNLSQNIARVLEQQQMVSISTNIAHPIEQQPQVVSNLSQNIARVLEQQEMVSISTNIAHPIEQQPQVVSNLSQNIVRVLEQQEMVSISTNIAHPIEQQPQVVSNLSQNIARVLEQQEMVSISTNIAHPIEQQPQVVSNLSQNIARVLEQQEMVSISTNIAHPIEQQPQVVSNLSQNIACVLEKQQMVPISTNIAHPIEQQPQDKQSIDTQLSLDEDMDIFEHSLLQNENTVVNNSNIDEQHNETNSTISNYSTPDERSFNVHLVGSQRQRKEKSSKNWIKIADYPSYQAAYDEIKEEKAWSICTNNNYGVIFRCNKVKVNTQQCQSGLKIVLSDYDETVSVFASRNPHNCDKLEKSKPKLDEDTKNFIKMHFDRGLKTKKIQDEFFSAGKPMPAKYLIENYVNQLRKASDETTRFSLADFKKLLDEYNKIPDDDLTAYVIDYQINDDGQDLQFNFVVSSKKLLQNNVSSRVCHADSTYKLIWQGFPVQVTGFTDGNKTFHASAISVSSTENQNDYTFVFNALKEGTTLALKEEWKPDIIMCDAAKAISNAFREVFGEDILELMCWFHAKCAMKDHVSTLIPSEKQKECLEDIDKLQLSADVTVFRKASELFIVKYCMYEEFVQYFKEQWLNLHVNWYEGAAYPIKAPSNNNGLEVFNRTLKDEKTLRRKLPLQVFFKQLMQWVHTWGSRYISGANVISQEPVIDLPLMTKAYQWKKQNKHVKKHPEGFLMVPAGKDINLDNWSKSSEWETFNEFKVNNFLGWSTIVPEEKWNQGTCNCPAFLKNFMCKHVVGIAIRLRLFQVPFEAKQIPIGQKRKRGRPKLAGKALVRE